MKKRLAAVIGITCLAIVSLTACAPKQLDTAKVNTESIETKPFDVGKFTIALPTGWTAFPQEDFTATAGKDGSLPIDDKTIRISRDTAAVDDSLTAPFISITWNDPTTYVSTGKDSVFKNVKDLDVTVQGVKAKEAFQGRSSVTNDVYETENAVVELEGGQYMIVVQTINNGTKTGYSITDPEIAAILDSIKTN